MALVQDELPKYLLAPEVSALFHYVPDLHRKMLRTVRTWINEAVDAAADGVTFSVPVTPHTFRHSYAMHMLYGRHSAEGAAEPDGA